MCVLGTEPRDTTPAEMTALCDLAGMMMAQIELQHALGRVDAVSGLPNRQQFIEDFQDLQLDADDGEQRMALLINLAAPQQLAHAARAMQSSYVDDLVTACAAWLRKAIGPGRKIYHVGSAQLMLLSPRGATQEITESAIMEQPATAHVTLAAIAELGVGLAIDDFGTPAPRRLRRSPGLSVCGAAGYSWPISSKAFFVPKLTLSPRTTAVLPE